jgi:predicted peptidase
MARHYGLWLGFELCLAATVVLAAHDAPASVLEKSMRLGNVDVQYKVVLPNGYDPTKAYPAILVMGEGPQTMDRVESTLERNFRAHAERLGYIVVAPAAPSGQRFFKRGASIFPEFLEAVLRDYRIAGRKFHVAGPSNGGISAFHVAAEHPNYFSSVTAFPGYMWQPTDAKLAAIAKMCVYMFIGENDEYPWHSEMLRETEFLRALGTVVSYTVDTGQTHGLDTLMGANAARLFAGFEATKKGCSH